MLIADIVVRQCCSTFCTFFLFNLQTDVVNRVAVTQG